MLKLFFRVACLCVAVDILAKYHPATAKIKHPSAKLMEKGAGFLAELATSIRDAARRLNDENPDTSPPSAAS